MYLAEDVKVRKEDYKCMVQVVQGDLNLEPMKLQTNLLPTELPSLFPGIES